MAGSTIGKIFSITTWGESHGEGIGVIIDGCPAGLPLSEELIQPYLDRRKPGQSAYTTKRDESDLVMIQSGVFNGTTTGTPISLMVKNTNQHSSDYSNIEHVYRPGHADYTYDAKYGFRDYRGGGRSSGRETIGRVAAGAVASLILKSLDINLVTYTRSIGDITIDKNNYNETDMLSNIYASPLYMPDLIASSRAEEYLSRLKEEKDSAGGIIECIVSGMPKGIGEPVFDRLDAVISKAIMSIGAVKGVEIGAGFKAASYTGSVNNDSFNFKDNNSGGILGGISCGSPIIIRAAVKPTPSIGISQQTIDDNGDSTKLLISGRHDPIIVPRAVVVVEAMTAISIVDLLLCNMSSKIDNIKKIYL